jgi:hypothetical protein
MRQRVEDQVGNVPICQRVVEVVSFATTNYQSLTPKDAQALRDRGELVVHRRHDLCHALFALL